MGEKEENEVRDFTRTWECSGTWDETQIERIVNFFAPDGRYHVFAWEEPPFVGHDEIRAELRREAPGVRDPRCEILNVASIDHTVFVERIDWITKNEDRVGIHVVGVFDVDGDGKIVSWRDYFDSREITIKAGTYTAGRNT
jgi:limonene-1,2-epoxide hydrolase